MMSIIQNRTYKLKNLVLLNFEKLDLPKETVRRKVLELEKEGLLIEVKKIMIDRKPFSFVKPETKLKLPQNIYLFSFIIIKSTENLHKKN